MKARARITGFIRQSGGVLELLWFLEVSACIKDSTLKIFRGISTTNAHFFITSFQIFPLYTTQAQSTMAAMEPKSNLERPWYEAYPVAKNKDPATISRADLRTLINEGGKLGNNIILVDLRRADHEVSLCIN